MRARILLLFLAVVFVTESQAAVGVRLIMGLTDSKSEKWDGSVTATGARVVKLAAQQNRPGSTSIASRGIQTLSMFNKSDKGSVRTALAPDFVVCGLYTPRDARIAFRSGVNN